MLSLPRGILNGRSRVAALCATASASSCREPSRVVQLLCLIVREGQQLQLTRAGQAAIPSRPSMSKLCRCAFLSLEVDRPPPTAYDSSPQSARRRLSIGCRKWEVSANAQAETHRGMKRKIVAGQAVRRG